MHKKGHGKGEGGSELPASEKIETKVLNKKKKRSALRGEGERKKRGR